VFKEVTLVYNADFFLTLPNSEGTVSDNRSTEREEEFICLGTPLTIKRLFVMTFRADRNHEMLGNIRSRIISLPICY
jgi:hypothetical protein